MTFDDTRETIVTTGSVTLCIIGALLAIDSQIGLSVTATISAIMLAGLYHIGRACNEARASGASRHVRHGIKSYLALAGIGSVITTAALSSESTATLAGGLTLYISTVVLAATFGTEYPSPRLDETLKPPAPEPTVSADCAAATATLVQELLDDLVRKRGKERILDDLPIRIEDLRLMDWTDQIIPAPENLGPVEIRRDADGRINAAGPDGGVYPLSIDRRRTKRRSDCTLARATIGSTVHLYDVPATTKHQTVHFEQRGWGPWGCNTPVPPGEHENKRNVITFNFTELRTSTQTAA